MLLKEKTKNDRNLWVIGPSHVAISAGRPSLSADDVLTFEVI